MKILFVNSVCGTGSTGRICTDLAEYLSERGWECRIAYGRQPDVPEKYRKYAMPIGEKRDVMIHALATRLLDAHGFFSGSATKKWLEEVKTFDPDIIHLHNIHGYYLNIPMLFSYIKESGKPVLWTLHDCWPFTGHCTHYDYIGCDKWKTGCHDCPQKDQYPATIGLDCSSSNFRRKKELFSSLPGMILATPSQWLADQVSNSFLKDYPVYVVNNGVDFSQFKPTDSNIREKYGLFGKKVVLGVAGVWTDRKGLPVFSELAKKLGDGYQIALVGLGERQIREMPDSILGIPRTNSLQELAAWYSAADVYVNASAEETMGLTALEAAACGTPAVVLDATALPEFAQVIGGKVVPVADIGALAKAVEEACLKKQRMTVPDLSQFYSEAMAERYIRLYETILRG